MINTNTNTNRLTLLILFFISINNATALSVTTARTIQGSLPSLFAADGPGTTPENKNDMLYFKIRDGVDPSSGEPKFKFFYGDSTNLFSEDFPDSFPVSGFITPDSLLGLWDNYDDSDGDLLGGVTTESFSKVLTDNLGRTVLSTDTLNSCFTPYTLTLKAKNIIVKSEYGDPVANNLGDLEKSFTINVNLNKDIAKLCFLKPLNMAWFGWSGGSKTEHPTGALDSSSSSTRDSIQGGGVSKDFIISKGFIPNPSASEAIGNTGNFPTTGFKGAKFSLIMSPFNEGYIFTPSAGITLENITSNTATVVLSNKLTNATITIREAGGALVTNYSFTIKTWADPYFTSAGAATNSQSYIEAQTLCGGLNNLLQRKEFTNTPRAYTWMNANNTLYTRAIGSIAGEWGSLSNNSANYAAYIDSGWISGYYWTSELSTNSPPIPYVSGVKFGSVVKYDPSDISQQSIYAACRR